MKGIVGHRPASQRERTERRGRRVLAAQRPDPALKRKASGRFFERVRRFLVLGDER